MFGILKKCMLTCGVDKETFLGVKDDIERSNKGMLRAVSFCGGVAWLLMLVISFIVQPGIGDVLFYLTGTVVSFLVWYLSERKPTAVLMYIFSALIMLFGIYISAVQSPGEKAVTYIVLLAVFPFLFTDRPVRITVFLWVMHLVFVLTVLLAKSEEVQRADIINATVYTVFGMCLGTYLQIVKVKHIFYGNQMEYLSTTDTETGLLNRRAYRYLRNVYGEKGIPEKLVVIGLDVNGLKEVNDSSGHAAGDKLLKDGAECIKSVFSMTGKCFRMGGDEFSVVSELGRDELMKQLEEFEEAQKRYRQAVNKDINISVGYAMASEYPGLNFDAIAEKADEMLYKNKDAYYLSMGIARGDAKEAYEALCDMYDKIIMLDLNTGLYREVKADRSVETGEKSFDLWIDELEQSGDIMREETERVKSVLIPEKLEKSFTYGEKNISISFKKQEDTETVDSEIEIVPTEDYGEDNKKVYIYVKDAE